jgi:multiple sugar transport system ATP-binding protein
VLAAFRNPDALCNLRLLGNLNADLGGQIRDEIIRLHPVLGVTKIYVTHDQVEAMTMADRIVVMRDGVIEQIETPLEIYDWPVDQCVASLSGSPRMNLLACVVTEHGHACELTFAVSLGCSGYNA